MTLEEILQQCKEDSEAWFPEAAPELTHNLVALAGEVGELCNYWKKYDRGSTTDHAIVKHEMVQECVDILIYLGRVYEIITGDVNLGEAYRRKREFNVSRFGVPSEASTAV